ncbi:MAG: hypothetical protein MJ145_04445 [Clostridia bacterium]|nr:hypothetical protein [Clostridia bacterium]
MLDNLFTEENLPMVIAVSCAVVGLMLYLAEGGSAKEKKRKANRKNR